MPSSCVVCKGSTSRPENFLLSCTICNSFWHHRQSYSPSDRFSSNPYLIGCHKPHIKDHVLVNIVNKFNQDRKTNPAARFAWTCDPCLKKTRSLSNAPILIDDDDDDDDIVILDGPPSKNTRPNAQNNPEAFHPLRSTIPTTKTQLSTPHIPEIQVRQAVVPSTTSKSQFVGHPQGTVISI